MMMNEHDMTKKMLQLIREATIPQFGTDTQINQDVPQQTAIDSDRIKINKLVEVAMEIEMDNIGYTLLYTDDDIQITTDGSVQVNKENNDNFNKLIQYKEKIWEPIWVKRNNEIKLDKLKDGVGVIVDENGVNQDYKIYYDEDINNLQRINTNITITDYRFTIQ
jgi:hypothetical protein